MKPTPEHLLAAAPDLDPVLLNAALRHLPEEYFAVFDRESQVVYLRLAMALTLDEPVFVLGELLPDGVRVTVVAFDAPGEFSWITGMMASLGANVRSGDGFTFALTPVAGGSAAADQSRRRRRLVRLPVANLRVPLPVNRIVDVFELQPLNRSVPEWAAISASCR